MSRQQESIDMVLAKYNRLVARFRDLEQQTTEKQGKWAELEREFKINESLTRELCELILAKDPSEMRLGKEYSWGKLKTRDIIQKSKSAFASYNESRTTLLRDIQRQSEERRVMIESLQAQIERDAHAMEQLRQIRETNDENSGGAKFDAETGEVIGEPKAVSKETMERVSYATQQAAERGDVEVVGYEGDDEVISGGVPEGRPSITQADINRGQNKPVTPTRMKIWKEKKDISQADVAQQTDMADTAVAVELERSGESMKPAPQQAAIVSTHRSKVEKQFMTVDVSKIAESLNGRDWAVLEIIGSTGLCEGNEIVDAAIDMLKQNGDTSITNNGARNNLMRLTNKNCLIMDGSVKHPLKSRFATYCLSDVGRALYISCFGKDPAVSERDILIADHDNLEHAFGIKTLKEILEKDSFYSNISMSRVDNRFTLKDGSIYIPDIVAQGKAPRNGNSFRIYMEYERGTHHQADWNIKLNKAVKLTKRLDIVCPSQEVAENMRDKVAAWVESRGGAKMLPQVKIRITTLRRINGASRINNDENWVYTFQLSNGDKPIERLG